MTVTVSDNWGLDYSRSRTLSAYLSVHLSLSLNTIPLTSSILLYSSDLLISPFPNIMNFTKSKPKDEDQLQSMMIDSKPVVTRPSTINCQPSSTSTTPSLHPSQFLPSISTHSLESSLGSYHPTHHPSTPDAESLYTDARTGSYPSPSLTSSLEEGQPKILLGFKLCFIMSYAIIHQITSHQLFTESWRLSNTNPSYLISFTSKSMIRTSDEDTVDDINHILSSIYL